MAIDSIGILTPERGNAVPERFDLTSGKTKTRSDGRIIGLDGLRSIAVLTVFISHYSPTVLPQWPKMKDIFPGMLGVTLFFFISGFLISTLLIREYNATQTIKLSSFYIRRVLRLTPALYFYVIAFAFAFYLADGYVVWSDIIAAMTYTSNYYQTQFGTGFYYMPVWSLAIEEHFYITFPLIMYLALRKSQQHLVYVVLSLIVVAYVWRDVVAMQKDLDWQFIYWRTDTRYDSILFGVLFACIFNFDYLSKAREFLRTNAALCLGVIVLGLSIVYRDEYFRLTARYSLQGVALLLIIGHLLLSRKRMADIARDVIELPFFKFISKISYSLYLWHLTILKFIDHLYGGVTPLVGIVCAVASFALAIASYHLIETPFLALRHKFGSHAAS